MRLGILVNTDRHLGHIIGLAQAALLKGHTVDIFIMDDGIKLLNTSQFIGLSRREGISMTYCEFDARRIGISREDLPPEVVAGSQYHNAVMDHKSDRVIVL